MKLLKRKRHVKVIYRLMAPMLLLAISGILVAITGMNSLTTSSKSMEKISGEGVQCIVALDEIAYDVEQTQKITLLYIADPTDEYMTKHALDMLKGISERMEKTMRYC